VIEARLVQAIMPVTPVINLRLDDKSIDKQINGPRQLSEAPLQQKIKITAKMKMKMKRRRRRRNTLGSGNGTTSRKISRLGLRIKRIGAQYIYFSPHLT
jgi:hypothetical protein